MTYEEALALIHSVDWRGSRPGLSRTRELLARLGNPEQKLKFVHIAGTNGKGSTAAIIASILERAEYRVGLYTSPFLYRFNERMQVNGEMIRDEELAELTEKIWPLAEAMEDPPTEFEIITALAMEFFVMKECDIVVLEVGLGGELDSTNVIPTPEVAVITSISLDHTAVLGDTMEEIARAKAGIIKDGCDVVSYGLNPEAEAVIEEVCRERHAKLSVPDYDALNPVLSDFRGQIFDYKGFRNLKIPMLGLYQMKNAAVALTAIHVLAWKGWHISDGNVKNGLEQTRWRGRLEIIGNYPTVVVDGSHNPDGIAATVESLENYFEDQRIVFLMGVMADKDVGSILPLLRPRAKEFITVTPNVPGRALPAKKLAKEIRRMGDIPVTAADSLEEGCDLALAHAGRYGVICVLGSLYMVGDVTREMKKRLEN